MDFNDLNNFQLYQAPTPTPPAPPAGDDADSKALNDLSSMLSNPALLKDGAQGALMGLLMYAAELCRKKQMTIRAQEAIESGQLATAQGQTAEAQADATKSAAYCAAGGMVGSAAFGLGTAGLSAYKGAKDQKELMAKGKEMDKLDKEINTPVKATTGAQANLMNKQEKMAKKESLKRDYDLSHGAMSQRLQTMSQVGHAGEALANAGGQVTSAQGKASEALLGTAAQQQSQVAQNLASAQQTASDVAKDLTNLQTLSGQAAKAAVGR